MLYNQGIRNFPILLSSGKIKKDKLLLSALLINAFNLLNYLNISLFFIIVNFNNAQLTNTHVKLKILFIK